MWFSKIFIVIAIFSIIVYSGCRPSTNYEESDIAVLAFIEYFSVPDTCNNVIPVYLRGIIGETTAYKFDRINIVKSDTLFQIAIWGRWVSKSNIRYDFKQVIVDTTLILTPSKNALHIIEVFASQGNLYDTTFVK